MTFALKNRVKQATQLTGINPTVTLTSAVSKFQTFAASGLSVGDVFPYLIESTALPEWEVGLGTWASSTTFTRTSVYNSSNSGALVDFSPGTKYVSLTIDAATLQAAVSPDTPIYFTDILGTASVGQIPYLDAGKITSGVFSSGRIPYRVYDFSELTGLVSVGQLPATIPLTQIAPIAFTDVTGSLPVGRLSGTLTHSQMASYAFSDITGSATLAQLPTIPTTKVSGVLPAMQIDVLPASQITTGVFDITRIPGIPAANIVGTLTHAQVTAYAFSDLSGSATLAQLPTTIPLTQIGTISFTDVGGSLPVTRLSGTLTHAQMASYAFSDITGTISILQLPATYLTAADVAAILAASPTISTFSNAMHNHLGASGGGTLTTASIASGTFATSFIPSLGDAKITDLAVTKLTGTLTHAQMASYAFSDITGSATSAQIPPLDTAKITTGLFAGARGGLGVDASTFSGLLKMATGIAGVATAETDYVTPSGVGTLAGKTLTTPTIASFVNATHTHQSNAGGGTLDAAAIVSGIFSSARIPALSYVTSVGLTLPAELTVSNSPVTTSGSLTGAWASQTTGKFFGAPNGSTGTPTFRALAKEDIAAAAAAGGIPFVGTTGTFTDTSTTASAKAFNVLQSGAITGTGYGGYFSKTGASTTNVGLYAQASGATNNYAAIFENGRVGIGTTTPGSTLTVSGNSVITTIANTAGSSFATLSLSSPTATSNIYQFGATYSTSGRFVADSFLFDVYGQGGLGFAANASLAGIRFYTLGNSERLRIDPNGLVGINTTGATAALQVHGFASAIPMITRQNATPGTVSIQEWQSSGGAALALIDYTGVGRFAGLRVDVAPTSAAVSQTHYINVSMNGVTYKLLLAA